MATSFTYTERSWGIDLISEINKWCSTRRLGIHKATGEQGLKEKPGDQTVFPDVLLRGRADEIILGWELKMPNTPVTDPDTVDNAILKARRMGTTSFLIWNVNEADLYLCVPDGRWRIAESFTLATRIDRSKVRESASQWIDLLHSILQDISDRYIGKQIRQADLSFSLGEPTYRAILENSVNGQTDALLEKANTDRVFRAQVKSWASESTVVKTGDIGSLEYRLLAETLIVNWLNKILFSHFLKKNSEAAYAIDDIKSNASIQDFLDCFEEISADSDFKSIFRPVLGQSLITQTVLSQIRQVNSFLKESTGDIGGEFDLSESLAGGMGYLRGKSNGQFSTPPMLARLLTRITMTNTYGHAIDPCSGSGTIAKSALTLKLSSKMSPTEAAKTLWASDKYTIPLSFTGIALADPEAMGQVQQVFLSDISDLAVEKNIEFVDPVDGETVVRTLPQFDTIVSNLPFIRFESIPESQDREKLAIFAARDSTGKQLSGKSDLYAYIILGLRKLISPSGRIGVITSNSWLSTAWGEAFLGAIRKVYFIELLVSSSKGRWFDNASVITTMIVLSPREPGQPNSTTKVVTTDIPIREWTSSWVDEVSDALLVDRSTNGIRLSALSEDQIDEFISAGVYLPMAAVGGEVLLKFLRATVPLSTYFDTARGSRPGAEKVLHFISADQKIASGVEDDYLIPMLHEPKSAFLDQPLSGVSPNYYFFICSRSTKELEQLGHTGALRRIERASETRNGKGLPLPSVLNGKPYWYTPTGAVKAELLYQMAPFKKFGVYRPIGGSIPVSQRFIAFTAKEGVDVELAHALLNSTVSYLWEEATGFPKGQGALDRNSTGLGKRLRIPNLQQLGFDSRAKILSAFEPLSQRAPLDFEQEICLHDRRNFDQVVLNEASIPVDLENLYEVFSFVVKSRTSAATD